MLSGLLPGFFGCGRGQEQGYIHVAVRPFNGRAVGAKQVNCLRVGVNCQYSVNNIVCLVHCLRGDGLGLNRCHFFTSLLIIP